MTKPCAVLSNNNLENNTYISLITAECAKMRVKVNKVGTLDNFNNCMLRVLQERRKAENVFLEDVEAEILQKEQFLKEQIEML